MSEILDVRENNGGGWWLILDCGHWFKWTGSPRLSDNHDPPAVGDNFPCPSDKPIVVKRGV
jgi:hypothetical protein